MMCLFALKLERRGLLYILGEEDETAGLRDEAEVTWHKIENIVSLGSVMHALNAQQTSLHSNVQDERMKSKGWNREPQKTVEELVLYSISMPIHQISSERNHSDNPQTDGVCELYSNYAADST